jgi:hypothetical protein
MDAFMRYKMTQQCGLPNGARYVLGVLYFLLDKSSTPINIGENLLVFNNRQTWWVSALIKIRIVIKKYSKLVAC